MRLLLSILAAMLMVQSANAQSLWRNFFTTNRNPLITITAGSNATVQASTVGVNQRVFTVNAVPSSSGFASNVYGTNVIGAVAEATHATNADYATYSGYATNSGFATNATTATNAMLLSSTGIGLADTNWVLDQISTFGAYVYFGGPTNTFAITNSGETVSRTNVYTGSTGPFVNASTSTISGLTLNAYVRHVISTNTFAEIEAGPVSITTYPFKTGALNPSGHYEFYVVDTVSNIMYELGATPTLTISSVGPTEIQSTMLLTNSFMATNRCYAALAFKVDGVGSPGATLSWAHGGNYGAHMTFVRPLSSATVNASQITGTLSPAQIATNTPAASFGQVLTATSASSAAWKDFGAQYTGFWNYGTNIVISPTNGNLQNWTLTNASYAAMSYDTNYTETIRLNIYNSNTITWTTTYLSNSAVLGPSNRISVLLFDHPQDTNLWQGYRLR